MAARFGDMLLEQRRRMGLSIQQVANTIKIRPQIIEFFENGNFASMPPRGYAQGMISSYARFLGLNPREVVNAYFDDLMAYERETSQQGGRFQDAAGYVNSRSSVDNGRFLMVQGGRSTRYGQRPQQAGYVTETGSSEDIRSQRDRFRSTPVPEERALPAARGVARDPRVGYGDGGYSDRGYRGVSSGRPRGGYADADTTQVTPRLRSQSQPYSQRSIAPRSGQRNYQGRGELASRSGQRNMQRQGSYRGRSDNNRGRMPQGTGRGGSNRGRGGGRAPQNNGLDPRIVYAGIGAVALLLIVLIVVLLRGCGSSAPESTPETPVATKTTTKKSSKKTESVDEDEDTDETTDESTDSDAANTKAKKEESEVTKVKISVAKGKTAWIEVKVDGKSVYGAQATGPFEQEYAPESSIEITTSKPSDVTVTKNGEKVRYDTKTSGVARVTITVPKKETTDAEDGETTDGTDDANSADGTDAQSSDGNDSATDGQTTTDSTDYSYDSY
ncbi:helix-turn-helix domain-containing protein [Collinsella aerofaciens]|uniref:helix-turn-helix domain-containing protein n=1 Tax=Collinsella aerofaciens TaxID=74426 RepID=UPI00359C5DAE